ncbi:DUF5988 family protein [Streptomyces laurentii]|uniref:DUF5988 family protein n=1 Tax=Streptomyces laurentii TaxID=39478 RepID=UPI0036A7AA0A
MDRFTAPHLVGGPRELLRTPPEPVREDPARLTYRWRNGYEHYEREERTTDAGYEPTYRWIYHTAIAE